MRAAFAAMAIAIAAMPLAAQAKSSPGSGAGGASSPASTTARPQAAPAAAPNESDLLIPDSGAAAGAAATQGSSAQQAPAASGVSTWDFVRMLLILAAVVGVIYLLFWLLRRSSGRKIQENDLIHVLGSRSLVGSRTLHLVEVGTSVYLVGASDGGVELIAEITDKESLDSVRLKAAEQGAAGRRTFQQLLSEIFRPAKRSFSVGDGIGFLKGQRERLKKL